MEQKGAILWFTGLSGSGKTTIAHILEKKLRQNGYRVERLDGDGLRAELARDLGYSREDRFTHIDRAGWIAQLLAKHGIIVLASFITPYQGMREQLRKNLPTYTEVYVNCSLEECIRRDVKGLYRRALKGEISHFTGISDPFEEPVNPDIVLCTEKETAVESATRLFNWIKKSGLLRQPKNRK